MGTLLYEKESYKLRGLWMKIYNTLGPGLKESIYANAFEDLLRKEKISYKREPSLPVVFEKKKVGDYRPDFLINDRIIVELKSQQQLPSAQAQKIYQYLKSSKYKLGFVVNFGTPQLQITRRIYDKAQSVKSVVIRNNPRNGFTLIEILIALSILAVLLGFTIPVGLNLLRTEQLSTAVDEVSQTLRRAQSLALAQENDSSYGVLFTSSDYTLFATRDSAFDQTYELPGDVSVSTTFTGNEVVFGKLSGRPNLGGSVTLSLLSDSKTIEVNSIGRVAIIPVCTGSPVACSAFSDQLLCQNQDGCAWNTALCSGTYQASCSVFTAKGLCQNQEGCTWNNATKTCGGTYDVSCNGFSDKTSCDTQTDCTWNPETCSGTATTCDVYIEQVSCDSQAGCAWQ